MELTFQAEKQCLTEVGENVRGALWAIGEHTGHIKQGLASSTKELGLDSKCLSRFLAPLAPQ
jgi:hypothetical protein